MKFPLVKVEDFCRTGSGATPARDNPDYYGGSIPWIKSGELRETLISKSEEFVTEHALRSTALKLVPPGAILIAMYGATVGRVGLLGIEATTNQAVCHIVPDANVADTRYVYHFMQSHAAEFVRRGVGGAQPNISQGMVRETLVPLPPLEEQKRIAAILDQADALRRLRADALTRLNALGQAIFHEMFGEQHSSVERRKLGDLCTKIGSGATPRGGDSVYKDHGIPLIRSMNVRDGYFEHKGLAFIDEEQADGLRNVIVQGRDVLLNITGASVARVGLAPMELAGARVNQHVAIIRPTKEIVPEFLEAFLLLPSSKSNLLRIAEAGATRQAITKSQIEDFEVPVLPLKAQEKFLARRNQGAVQVMQAQKQAIAFETLFTSLQHRAFRGEL